MNEMIKTTLKISEVKNNPNNPRLIKCLTCSVDFVSKKACATRTPKYCSKNCYAESLKKYKTCKMCSVRFANYKNLAFCSKSCYIQYSIENAQPKKDRAAKYRHKRRSEVIGELDISYLPALLAAQGNNCFYCEHPMTSYRAVEHLTPVSRGGSNAIYNIVYSCRSCNSKKRDKTLEDWAIKTGNLHWLDKFDRIFAEALCNLN